MTLELFCIILLGALNVIQFAFWGFQNQRLVNKLMSRNYEDYVAWSQKPRETVVEFNDPVTESEERDILKEVNAMLG